MQSRSLIALLLVLLTATPLAAMDERSLQTPAFSLRELVATRVPGQFVLSPDRQTVVHTQVGRFFGHALLPDFGEDSNLVLRNLRSGKTTRLTANSKPAAYPAFSADGRYVSYESEGDIWSVNIDTGKSKRLTTHVSRDSQAAWSPQGTEIAFVSSRWGRSAIYVMSADGEREGLRQVTPDGFGGRNPVWSPDGRLLLFYAERDKHPYASGIYSVAASGGEPKRLTPDDNALNAWPQFAPDGHRVAYVSDRSGFLNLWEMSPDGNGHRQIAAVAQDQYYHDNDYIQTVGLRWSPDGKRLLHFTNRLGNLDLIIVEVASGKISVVSDKDGSHHPVGWIDDKTIAFVYEDYRTPPDLYVKDLSGSGQARQLTHSGHAVYREADFDKLESVHWASEDAVQIHGYLRTPSWLTKSKTPLPAVVVSHTYEVGQFYNQWNPVFSHIVQAGYVLLTVNHRGSSGYGTKFRDLPRGRGNWGFSHVKDLASAAAYLRKMPQVDAAHVGILGYSMGGFLVLFAITDRPDVFQAGISVFGLGEVTEDPRDTAAYFTWHLGGSQAEAFEAYREASPVYHVNKISAPLQIIHSDQDPIEPVTKVRNFVHELDKYGKEYELWIYENEAHGLVQLDNQLDAYSRVMNFLRLHLHDRVR